MANPVRAVGRDLGIDIIEEAARQDEEREIREADERFRMTGENPRPRRLDSPLVDNNYSPDIANDGDSYEESAEPFNHHTAEGEYVEDNPSQFMVDQEVSMLRFNAGQNYLPRRTVVEAYNDREKEKEQREMDILKQKRMEESKNAITEIQID